MEGRLGERRDIVVEGRRIAYLEAGQGNRTCLLLHGLAASWDYWTHTIPALAATHRVIAVDLPGFGRSENPEAHGIDDQLSLLPTFLDAIAAERVDVVGHSMGTLIACELAARYPFDEERCDLGVGDECAQRMSEEVDHRGDRSPGTEPFDPLAPGQIVSSSPLTSTDPIGDAPPCVDIDDDLERPVQRRGDRPTITVEHATAAPGH